MADRKAVIETLRNLFFMASDVGSTDGNESWASLDELVVEAWEDVPLTLTDPKTGEFFEIHVRKSRKIDNRFA